MNGIESRLNFISDLIIENRGDTKGIEDMIQTIEMELVQLSDRWITGRKLSAKSKLSWLEDKFKAQNSPNNSNSPNNLPSSPEELKKELEVVLEEIKRGRDNPNSVVSHELFAQAYKGNRLGRPVIGYQEVVETDNLVRW